MKILIVDDNQFILEVISGFLKAEGFEHEHCTSVNAALELLETKGDFDMVITDIVMPEKDGVELARHVKSEMKNVPVIIITGGVENAMQDYVNYGEMFADATLAKPLQKDELIETINRLAA